MYIYVKHYRFVLNGERAKRHLYDLLNILQTYYFSPISRLKNCIPELAAAPLCPCFKREIT